jgi:hypothetical protein
VRRASPAPSPDAGGSPRWTSGTRSTCSTPRIFTFSGKDGGELVFIAIEVDLDVRYGARDGSACAEFSWEGFDDGSPASGRGWAALGTAGRLVGHIFIHKGDDSGFVAKRE